MMTPLKLKGGFLVSVALAGVSIFHAFDHGSQQLTFHQPGTVQASTAEQPTKAEVVLLDATVPASFVESLRSVGADRRFMVLSATSPVSVRQGAGPAADLAASMEQVKQVIAQEEVKYVVVSDAAAPSNLESSLRALLRSDARFKLLGTYPIQAAGRDSQIRSVSLYLNAGSMQSAMHYVPVRMVTVNSNQPIPAADLASATVPAK
jgi:hypothetical protein